MSKTLSFRLWLQEMYYENCNENESFQLPRYQLKEYFHKYKYWLKREYKHQRSQFDQ